MIYLQGFCPVELIQLGGGQIKVLLVYVDISKLMTLATLPLG